MHKPTSRVPDLLLERYALGELASAERERLQAHLKNDPALQERLDSLRASNAAFLKSGGPEALVRRLQDRLRRERVEREIREAEAGKESRAQSPAGWRFGLRSALAGTAVLALVAVPAWKTLREGGSETVVVSESGKQNGPETSSPESGLPSGTGAVGQKPASSSPSEPTETSAPSGTIVAEADQSIGEEEKDQNDVRLKGLEPRLALFRKTEQGAEPLRPGASARPGDLLRIGYNAGGLPYGAIYSVDGSGNVTRHWPASGDKAGRLEAGESLLPGAFELDAAPRFERFYLLVSKRAFELEPVREALRGLKNPAIRDGKDVKIVRFDILKDEGI